MLEGTTKKILEALNPTKKDITASTAYMISHYGKTLTAQDLYNRTIEKANETIRFKIERSFDSTIAIDIPQEIRHLYEDLIAHFEERGFKVFLIDNGVNINGEVVDGISSPLLIINWSKLEFLQEK